MVHSFIKATRLRSWLSRPQCSPAIKECEALFNRVLPGLFDSRINETANEDTETYKAASNIPLELLPLLKDKEVHLPARFKQNGVTFARSSTHLGNSFVLFYPNGNKQLSPEPGQIEHIIVELGSPETVTFAIKCHLPLSPETVDPFKAYEHLPMKLYSSQLTDELQIINIDWIFGQFARCSITSSHVVVLSLSRVRNF
jgi:hypothetical protein